MHLAKSLLVSAMLAFATQAFAAEAPGLIERQIDAPHHSRSMPMAIWYPATEGTTEMFAANAIFQGGEVRRGAPLPDGKHPVVLLSHGMGGSYLSLNWLASGLAARGAIVVAVNHPNGWFKDRDKVKLFNHWTRVQDLQAALDYVLADKDLAQSIDPDRIYVTGFSFGGWTALSMGGATQDATGSYDYCKNAGERAQGCSDLKHWGYDPAKVDLAKWTASWKDARIKAVAALDPGLTWNMKPENVQGLDQRHLLVIGLGNTSERHYATDTTAAGSKFDKLVPLARIEVVSPATHFTGMPLCTDKGAAILAEEKDDPVCTDPPGADRKAVHEKIISLIAEQFQLN